MTTFEISSPADAGINTWTTNSPALVYLYTTDTGRTVVYRVDGHPSTWPQLDARNKAILTALLTHALKELGDRT